jgi:putative Mg2+ transporter-C (MgtC) family protein
MVRALFQSLAFPRRRGKAERMLDRTLGSDDFNILPHLVALVVAYVLAFPIGWNREQEERSAGLRTFPLVAVATCGFIQAAEGLAAGEPEAMARIIEGLITGMGFIGGGAILRQANSVKGTATAASLWVTGAIGVACGLGSYDVAVMLSVSTIATLWIFSHGKRTEQDEPSKPEDAQAKASRD